MATLKQQKIEKEMYTWWGGGFASMFLMLLVHFYQYMVF
jgi:hypothetical protein